MIWDPSDPSVIIDGRLFMQREFKRLMSNASVLDQKAHEQLVEYRKTRAEAKAARKRASLCLMALKGLGDE